jgi:hypothetical protein
LHQEASILLLLSSLSRLFVGRYSQFGRPQAET